MTVGASSTITVRLLLFAAYAELAGADELELQVAAPARVADVLRVFRQQVAAADRLPPHPLVAVNQAHASPESAVQQGDEVAILPPMAGG
jgi:molybdopterin converting factor small subunit